MIADFLDARGKYRGRWHHDNDNDEDETLRFRDVLVALVLSALLWTPIIFLARAMLP